MPTVFVSDAVDHERLIFSRTEPARSAPDRGWKALSALYQASLRACGYRVEWTARPEIYQTDWAHQLVGVQHGDWHLAVKPIEHIRPFHRIPNVFVCNWPFAELSDRPFAGIPFFNQVALLKRADAVACCTDFTTRILQDAGIARVVTLPPCMMTRTDPVSPAMPRRRTHASQTFLTVVEMDHLPRQLGSAIEGFSRARARRDDLALVVCLQGIAPFSADSLNSAIAQILGPLQDDAVSFIAAGSSAGSVADLLAQADFFLCASSAEGLWPPMIEAMLAGVPLVTTRSAGTGTFLPAAAAVDIQTVQASGGAELTPLGAHMALTHNPPTAETICDAILAAAALGPQARSRMVETCRDIVLRRFGRDAFETGLKQLAEFVPALQQGALQQGALKS